MGVWLRRVRIQVAKSPVDRELQVHLSDAERSLSRAQEVCRRLSRDSPEKRRADSVAKDIHRALGIVQQIGHLESLVDPSDPDLMSEDMLNSRARERRDASRKNQAR